MDKYENDTQQDLEQHYKQDLEKFAKWVGEKKFKYDGISIWKQSRYVAGNRTIKEYFSTAQLIEKFLKEN